MINVNHESIMRKNIAAEEQKQQLHFDDLMRAKDLLCTAQI